MKINSKILIVAVAAMFCVSAFVGAATSYENDGADKTYRLYVEILDEDGNVAFSKWVSQTGEYNVKGYIDAMDSKYSQTIVEANLSILGITDAYYIDDSWGGVTFNYDFNFVYAATFYEKDGKWAEVSNMTSDYVNSKSAAIILCPVDIFYNYFYLEKLPAGADPANYVKGSSGFMLLPNSAPMEFENPMMFYILIAIVAIIAIAVLALFLVKRNKNKTI